MEQRLYTIPEMAALVRVSRSAGYQLVKDGVILSVRVPGGGLRVTTEAIDDFVAGLEIVEPQQPTAA